MVEITTEVQTSDPDDESQLSKKQRPDEVDTVMSDAECTCVSSELEGPSRSK